jgi:hypothetical protein
MSGLLIAAGLMVFDEILTLAMYCGRECHYPVPGLWSMGLYDAEGFAWTLILLGIGVLLTANLSRLRRELCLCCDIQGKQSAGPTSSDSEPTHADTQDTSGREPSSQSD